MTVRWAHAVLRSPMAWGHVARGLSRKIDLLRCAGRILREGASAPLIFGMVLTDRCNLACHYCESKNLGHLHFGAAHAVSILREAYEQGYRVLYFTGGEPTLWEDHGCTLADLARFARELGFFRIVVYTNGTRSLDIPGCTYVVTVEGPPAVHNPIRRNSYDLMLRNVRAALVPPLATMTLTNANAPHVDAYVRSIASQGCFRAIAFNLLTGRKDLLDAHGLTQRGRVEVLDKLWKLKRAGYPILLSRATYRAMRRNDWRRPLPGIALATDRRVFVCCRDREVPGACDDCGYAGCAEVAEALRFRPSACFQALSTAW